MFPFLFTASSTQCTIQHPFIAPTHSHLVQTLPLFLKRLVCTHFFFLCAVFASTISVERRFCVVSMSVLSHLCNVLIFLFLMFLMALVSRFSCLHKESFHENTQIGAHTRSQYRTHGNHGNEPALHSTVPEATCYSASWFFSEQKNFPKTNEIFKTNMP